MILRQNTHLAQVDIATKDEIVLTHQRSSGHSGVKLFQFEIRFPFAKSETESVNQIGNASSKLFQKLQLYIKGGEELLPDVM